MKTEIDKPDFQPFDLVITIESLEEAQALYNVFSQVDILDAAGMKDVKLWDSLSRIGGAMACTGAEERFREFELHLKTSITGIPADQYEPISTANHDQGESID